MSKIQQVAESDSDDGGMASGIMTPPKRSEDVISEKSKGLKSQSGGVDVDELEAYLRKNQAASPPKVQEESFKMAAEPLPKSKDSSFSEKDKAGFYE
jgi:hypothetical protein